MTNTLSDLEAAEAVSIADTARLCGIGRSTLFALIKDRKGPHVTKLGRRSIILRDDRKRWLIAVRLGCPQVWLS